MKQSLLKTIIIDDEGDFMNRLTDLLSKTKSVSIEGTASSFENGLKLIKQKNPDLVFLDIELGQLNGFDMLSSLKEINFQVVFMNSHDHYALKAIKFSAVDYLLKPFDKTELDEAIEKVKKNMANNLNSASVLLNNDLKQSLQKQKIGLHTFDGINYIVLEDIVRCKADGNYTEFYMTNDKKIMVSFPIKKYEDLLDEYDFLRVHKSHLINLNHVAGFLKEDSGQVMMNDGIKIEISRRKKELFLKRINVI